MISPASHAYQGLRHLQPIFPHQHYRQQQHLPLSNRWQRRARTNFTGFQLHILEQAFAGGHYPDCAKVTELSHQLRISETRVQVSRWLVKILAKESDRRTGLRSYKVHITTVMCTLY